MVFRSPCWYLTVQLQEVGKSFINTALCQIQDSHKIATFFERNWHTQKSTIACTSSTRTRTITKPRFCLAEGKLWFADLLAETVPATSSHVTSAAIAAFVNFSFTFCAQLHFIRFLISSWKIPKPDLLPSSWLPRLPKHATVCLRGQKRKHLGRKKHNFWKILIVKIERKSNLHLHQTNK